MRMLKDTAVPSIFSHKENTPSKRKRTAYVMGANVRVPDQEEVAKEIGIQTDLSGNDIEHLMKINKDLKIQFQECTNNANKNMCTSSKFSLDSLSDDDIKKLTGFRQATLLVILNFCSLSSALGSAALTPMDILFLTMLRLRQGISFHFLSVLFDLSPASLCRHFNECLKLMYQRFKSINIWPNKEKVISHMPRNFKHFYPSCRVIIDCTEYYVQKPTQPSTQQASWSNYKNHNTVKSLIGIAPSGAVSFISDLWYGGISDKELTLQSGLLNILEKGDTVLADRGFTVLEHEFKKKDMCLETPYFLSHKSQFDVDERSENKRLSHLRVHVERAIGRIKNFKILNGIIPVSLLLNINKIHYVCAFLTNFSEEPLIDP